MSAAREAQNDQNRGRHLAITINVKILGALCRLGILKNSILKIKRTKEVGRFSRVCCILYANFLGVSGARCVVVCRFKRMRSLGEHPIPLRVRSLRSRRVLRSSIAR